MGSRSFPGDFSVVEPSGCFFFRAPSGWVWERPDQPFHNFWMVLEGHGVLKVRGRSVPLGPGSCVMLGPRQLVRVEHDRRRPILNFAAHVKFRQAPGSDAGEVVRMNDLVGVTVLARKSVEGWAAGDLRSRRQVAALLEALLLEYARMKAFTRPGSGYHDGRILELANRIRMEPGQGWRVAACAAEVGLSRSQYTRLFRRLTGHVPMRFLVKCRMQRAGRMLLETSRSISEVAEALGYRDVFYFSKHFRAEMGKPPTRYRREGR